MPTRLVANALDATFSKGDAIAIDMPMTVFAVIIYLAIVLAGFVVVSIADSFAAKEIATRLRVSRAKAIFTQNKLHYFKVSNSLHKPSSRVKPYTRSIACLGNFHNLSISKTEAILGEF
ncbi:hypothetical protein U1Q18_032039 [Sarracenia purpurea var. burkii]